MEKQKLIDALSKAIAGAVDEIHAQIDGKPAEGKPEQKALPLDDKSKEAGNQTTTAEATPPTSTGKETQKEDAPKTGTITITQDSLATAIANAIKQNAPDVGAPNTGGQALTMDAIKQMSEAEINANWEQVSKVLADSKGAQQ